MTTSKRSTKLSAVEAVAGDRDLMKVLMKEALQEVLQGEMERSRVSARKPGVSGGLLRP